MTKPSNISIWLNLKKVTFSELKKDPFFEVILLSLMLFFAQLWLDGWLLVANLYYHITFYFVVKQIHV